MSISALSLEIATPLEIAVQDEDVRTLRAEDASGAFGLLPGHADLVTALSICVVAWRSGDGRAHYCAVRQGVLTVTGGRRILIATREAVASDDLAALEPEVIAAFHQRQDADRVERVASLQLQVRAARQLVGFLRPGLAPASAPLEG